MRSPTDAPARVNAVPAGTRPCTVRVMFKGPRATLPPTRATPCCLAREKKPRLKPSSQASSASGKVSAINTQAGVAPMAARSLRLQASARCPTASAGRSGGKCTRATGESVLTASSWPAGTFSSAASSPMPKATSPRPCAGAAKKRRMSANSSMRSARGAFRLAQSDRGLVQHCVDVLVTILGAETLGQLHGFVQDHPVWHVDALLEFEGADQQDAALDGVHLLRGPVQMRLEQRLQGVAARGHAAHQGLEIFGVHVLDVLAGVEFRDQVTRRGARQLPLIEPLQGQPPGLGARAGTL